MKPHEHVAAFGTVDGELRVGGLPLQRLAARVGSTPFFAYDRGLLDARVDRLRAALPDRVELSYAMKANPMPAVVQHLARRVDRIDVASGTRDAGRARHHDPPRPGELRRPGQDAGRDPAGRRRGHHRRGRVHDRDRPGRSPPATSSASRRPSPSG